MRSPIWTLSLNHLNNGFVCGGLNGLCYICSTSNCDTPERVITLHKSDIIHCVYSENDLYVFTADVQGIIRMINSVTGNCERIFIVKSAISAMCLCDNDTLLMVGDEHGDVFMFDVNRSSLLSKLSLFDCV